MKHEGRDGGHGDAERCDEGEEERKKGDDGDGGGGVLMKWRFGSCANKYLESDTAALENEKEHKLAGGFAQGRDRRNKY